VEEDEDVVTNEGLDVDTEGLLDEAPRGRSFNYDVYEEKLIRMAWKKIGLDAVVGTEQPGKTYWNRMNNYFNANTKGNHRSIDSIRQKSSCLAHVNRLNPSGTNDDDRVTSLFIFST
jgi:hypothetical protein